MTNILEGKNIILNLYFNNKNDSNSTVYVRVSTSFQFDVIYERPFS